MKILQIIVGLAAVGSVPHSASAALVAALDFAGGGSAWTIETFDGGLPLTFGLDGDPTNVGIANAVGSGHYGLHQEIFAPAGFTMSNIMVTAKASGYSSWVMDGRIGLHTSATFALNSDYSERGAIPNGVVNVDVPKALNAAGDPDYTNVSSVFINLEIVKGLEGVWQANNVREIQVFADLTPTVPEPTTIVMLSIVSLGLLAVKRSARRRAKEAASKSVSGRRAAVRHNWWMMRDLTAVGFCNRTYLVAEG